MTLTFDQLYEKAKQMGGVVDWSDNEQLCGGILVGDPAKGALMYMITTDEIKGGKIVYDLDLNLPFEINGW